MTTPNIIIENVLETLERPDLETSAKSRFPAALRACHAIRKLRQDLDSALIVDFQNDDGRVNLGVGDSFPGLREIREIQEYQEFTEVEDTFYPGGKVETCHKFVDRNSLGSDTDYFGFQVPKLYTLLGQELVIRGVDTRTQLLKIYYLKFPAVTIDRFSGELITDSWIVREWPAFVEAQLLVQVVGMLKDRDMLQFAAGLLQSQSSDFISTVDGDVLHA